jgi:hypothetical protein
VAEKPDLILMDLDLPVIACAPLTWHLSLGKRCVGDTVMKSWLELEKIIDLVAWSPCLITFSGSRIRKYLLVVNGGRQGRGRRTPSFRVLSK